MFSPLLISLGFSLPSCSSVEYRDLKYKCNHTICKPFSDFFHFPVCFSCLSFVAGARQWPPSWMWWAGAVGTLVCTVLSSTLVCSPTECMLLLPYSRTVGLDVRPVFTFSKSTSTVLCGISSPCSSDAAGLGWCDVYFSSLINCQVLLVFSYRLLPSWA